MPTNYDEQTMSNYDNCPHLYEEIKKNYANGSYNLWDAMFSGYDDTYITKIAEGD